MSSLAAIAATVRVISDIFIDANEPFTFVQCQSIETESWSETWNTSRSAPAPCQLKRGYRSASVTPNMTFTSIVINLQKKKRNDHRTWTSTSPFRKRKILLDIGSVLPEDPLLNKFKGIDHKKNENHDLLILKLFRCMKLFLLLNT